MGARPSRSDSRLGRARRACALEGLGFPAPTEGRVRWRMRVEPALGRGLLRGQPAHNAPAQAEGGGCCSWWELAALRAGSVDADLSGETQLR